MLISVQSKTKCSFPKFGLLLNAKLDLNCISCWLCLWLNVLFISHSHAAVTTDAMTASLSFPRFYPNVAFLAFPFSSLLFLMPLWGLEASSSLASDWTMCEVIRCNESMHNSKDVKQKKRRGRMWHRREGGEMFWRALFERDEDGDERCGCLFETMGAGHSFTDSLTLAHFLWETAPQTPSPSLPTISGCWSESAVEIAQWPSTAP